MTLAIPWGADANLAPLSVPFGRVLDSAKATQPLSDIDYFATLIAAHYLDGARYEELAEALALPLGTVKTYLYRAKQQLRRLLETELK